MSRNAKSLSKIVERDCVPHHPVLIAPGLRLASPKNRNISNIRQRLSANSLLDCANLEYRDGSTTSKKPQLAGASGIYEATISWEDSNFDTPISKNAFEMSAEFPLFWPKTHLETFAAASCGSG